MSASADTLSYYQVFVNNVLRLSVNENAFAYKGGPEKFIALDQGNYSDTFKLIFRHCAPNAMNRRLQLLSEGGEILHEWKYPMDDPDSLAFAVYSILDNKQISTGDTLQLIYYDSQVEGGVPITFLGIGQFYKNEMVSGGAEERGVWKGWYVFAVLTTGTVIFFAVRKKIA